MRLVQVKPPQPQKTVRPRRHRLMWLLWLTVPMLLVNFFRPLPPVSVSLQLPRVPAVKNVDLRWPANTQAAIAADGYGTLSTNGTEKPMATASIAKVITALCVLEKHPLKLGEAGPTITLSQADVDFFEAEIEQDGSRVPVYVGEQLNEYQMLQGVMIPSANNYANSLAVWAFGSIPAYAEYANSYVLRHGLINTHIGSDASGYDSSTTSTATDLARLGLIAQKNATLMAVAGQTSVTLPNSVELRNYNSALGVSGITGLKTGNNEQNPGGLLFTADVPVAGTTVHVSGAVIGAANLSEAISGSETLVQSAAQNFSNVPYVTQGQTVGVARTAWGSETPVVAKSTLRTVRWNSTPVRVRHTLQPLDARQTGDIGALVLQTAEVQKSTQLVIEHLTPGPSFWWRLTRL